MTLPPRADELAAVPVPPVALARAGLVTGTPRATLGECNVFDLARLAAIDATTDAGRAFVAAAAELLALLEGAVTRGGDAGCSSLCAPEAEGQCSVTADGRCDASGAVTP